LPQRGRHKLSAGEVVVALICSRLASPSPLYDVAGWASGAAMQELFGIPHQLLNDDRLGRCLEALCSHAEGLRGAVMLRAIERFGVDAARLHLDLTALRVAGAYEHSALVEKGWGADRRVARQIRALQATSAEGVPLYLRPGAGSAAELAMIGQGLQRLRELLPAGLLVIADSALGNLKPLCEADRAGLGIICPLRAVTGFRERFRAEVGDGALRPLRYVSERERRLPPARRTRYRGALRPFEVTDPETGERRSFRVAYIHSSEERREVAAARERALRKAEEALGRIERGLGGRHYPTRAHVDRRLARVLAPVQGLIEAASGERHGRPTLRYRRDEEAIARAALTDGLTALATNLPGRLSAGRVLGTYKRQWLVERRHRDLKQTLRVRPIFLQNDDCIEALVGVRRAGAAHLRPDRSRAAPPARRRTAARAPARGPPRPSHRSQHPRRLPGPQPHLHRRRDRARPPHPNPAARPRATRDRCSLARAGTPSPYGVSVRPARVVGGAGSPTTVVG
jgi:hypothetical protein